MLRQLKKFRVAAVCMAILSGISLAEASAPGPHEGVSIGIGAGVKLLNLKNIATRTTNAGVVSRSHDGMTNASSPVIGLYARKYVPNFICWPAFFGLEFNYLTDMRKTSLYARLNNLNQMTYDTGFHYRETWDARAMLGVLVWCAGQLDFWAQAGVQATYFKYEGIINEVFGQEQRFRMHNEVALAPAGGLEVRFTKLNLFSDNVATDFILGWTAGYRNAFKLIESSNAGNTYHIAMSSNWNHTFGLKVMFRF